MDFRKPAKITTFIPEFTQVIYLLFQKNVFVFFLWDHYLLLQVQFQKKVLLNYIWKYH